MLDAGCGAGEWVAFLNENGYAAEGLDFSSELIERTKVLYPQYQWRVASVQQLPYDDESFDAVISWGVIEHDERGPAATLEEFWRVLKHGGVAIVTVPVDTDRQRRSSQAHFPPDLARSGSVAFFQYFMTIDELAGFVRRAGFAVIDSGLQHSASITLFAPGLSTRLSLPLRNWLNKAVRLLLWWHRGSMNMTYCIATKVDPAASE